MKPGLNAGNMAATATAAGAAAETGGRKHLKNEQEASSVREKSACLQMMM